MRGISWIDRIDLQLRNLTPFFFTLIMVIISSIPWQIPSFAQVTPAFTAISLYYWTIYRPDKLPYIATFLLALLLDLLTGNPLGLSALVYLVIQAVLSSQRTFFNGKPFLVVWWGFSLVMISLTLVSWIISSLFFATLLPPMPFIIQSLLTVFLYPLISLILSSLHRLMLKSI